MGKNREDSKLGRKPVGPLLISMALPMMLSFFIQALYNVVDSIFVAQISENALTAVSLAFPMQQIMTAIAVGTGVGINALVPRFMGAGDQRKAETVANTGVFLNLIYTVLFIILGILVSAPFYHVQTNVPEIVDGGIVYLRINWIVCAGVFFGQYFEKMLTSTGAAAEAMFSQASGAVFNIVFDLLLIFGMGPFPKLGIAGAAWATVLGQILAAAVAMYLSIRRNKGIHFSVYAVSHPSGAAAKEIYGIAVPSMITIGLTSITGFLINQVLLAYSTTATAVYGIWMKLQNFCFMPAFGMNNGMVPILSYNYGTGDLNRVKKTIRYANISIMALMAVLTLILELIPGPLLKMFNASENMLSIGMPALRVCVLSLVFGGVSVVLTSAMQALDHARYTLIVNVLRNFAALTGLFYLLSVIFGKLEMLWAAVPVSEAISFAVTLVLYVKMDRHLKEAVQRRGKKQGREDEM